MVKIMEKELKEKLKNIKAIIFDCDGVVFTGQVFCSKDNSDFLKERSHIDGQGLVMLMAVGLKIAFVTAEKTGFIEKYSEKLNGKDETWEKTIVFSGFQGKEKVGVIDSWLKEIGVSWQECAAMGDDVGDLELLKKVGFSAAPFQAEKEIKEIVDYVAPRQGGRGAVRDLCNIILEAKKI